MLGRFLPSSRKPVGLSGCGQWGTRSGVPSGLVSEWEWTLSQYGQGTSHTPSNSGRTFRKASLASYASTSGYLGYFDIGTGLSQCFLLSVSDGSLAWKCIGWSSPNFPLPMAQAVCV